MRLRPAQSPWSNFGSALNLNIHFHMRFLDGVYIEHPDGSLHFR